MCRNLWKPLTAGTEYTVCVVVKTAAAQTAESSATFETAIPPDTDPPLSENATAITPTTAEPHGEPNPATEATIGLPWRCQHSVLSSSHGLLLSYAPPL